MRIKPSRISKTLFIFFVSFVAAFCFVGIPEVQAGSPNDIIFTENFETGTGNWVLDGNFTATNTIAHGGSYVLALNTSGNVSKQFPMYGTTGINSPNRDIVFYWYPNSSNILATSSILSFEEGAWTTTEKSIEMFWDGNQAYFNLYRYTDQNRTSTTTSSYFTISNNTWHKIEIISNTTLTQIKIDNVAIQFGGSDSSTILTNVYNLIRFSTGSTVNVIKDDDGLKNHNVPYISGSTYRYKKELIMSYDPSDPAIASTTLSFHLDKDNTLVGNVVVDVNGQRAITLSNNDIASTTPNPNPAWYSFPINKALLPLLVQGTNSIVVYAEGGATNVVLDIDTDSTSSNRSASSNNSGATWNYNDLNPLAAAKDGEYMVRLNLTIQHTFNIDDISVSKENIVNTSDLFGKTFDALTGAVPSGTDKIQAIHQYMLTRDSSYLAQAETGADSIQVSYNSGNRDLFYVKEMALLANIDSSRVGLLNNLADALWTYRVNQTTFLPYYGSVSDNVTMVGEPPDALDVANAFMFAYKTTNNTTYLDHAKVILNAIYTYMRHPTYGTIVTSANTQTGAQGNTASRGDDELKNFIETAIFLYEISGNQTYLTWATDQADLYTQYAWNNTRKVYQYRPDSTGYEVYIPAFSLALLHLYQYTGNQTYLDNAKDNFTTYLTKIKRNGLLEHQFAPDGRYSHGPAYLNYEVPHVAALLYKYTSDSTYLDISDEYTSILLNYYYPTNSQSIVSDSFVGDNGMSYFKRQTYTTDLLSRFILPSSGVNISWAYGNDLHGRYRGIASAPIDVWFARDAVHLNDVSGTGTIKLYPDIKKVYITPRAGSRIGLQMLSDLSITPTTGSVDVEVGDSLIDIDYANSAIAGLSVSNVDRQIDINSQGISSMTITPSASSIDVAIDTWNTTSTYYKKWTEHATTSDITTNHTIGDLRANQYYQLKINGTVSQTFQANSSGTISFTYSGGYSDKTFEVEEIPTVPTISTPTPLSSSAIRWNFTDNSDNETGLRVYTNADAIATSSATANLTYLDETGLSENTQYTRYVKAYNSYGESSSSSATSTYTLADTPTGFNFMRHPSSLDIYVDSFPNSNSGSSGYLFWRTDNSAYNSGWIQTNNWQDPNMVEGQTYTYAVKYRNGNGTETATTTMGGVSFVRDSGGGGTPTIPQQTTSTSSVQATTTLSNTTSTIQATSTQATSSVSFEKPISQMSKDEIIAKITQITQMIAQLQLLLANSISTIPNTFLFKDTLKQGVTDTAVKYLQIILNQDPETQVAQTGVGSPGKETNYFGQKTKQAVIKFQEKYKDAILKPWSLTKSTGIIGKTTRDKLNSLLSK